MTEARFAGRHVVVTGAGRGIGRAIASAFAEEGARLSLFSRSGDHLTETARLAGAASPLRFAGDVTDRGQVAESLAAARAKQGPVDILINNAGIFLWKPFLETSSQDWDRVLATNLTGAFNFCREVLPEMAERKSGRIVNIASIHGLHGDANLAPHCASKFGLIGLTQSLAREFRRTNITVNALCPGTTENRAEPSSGPPPALSEKLRPRDVAAAALWLCSGEASGITGASIEIYGGTHIRIEP